MYACAMQASASDSVKRVLLAADTVWVCCEKAVSLLSLSSATTPNAAPLMAELPEPMLDACVWQEALVCSLYSGSLAIAQKPAPGPEQPASPLSLQVAPPPAGRRAYCVAANGRRLVCGCGGGEVLTWWDTAEAGCGFAPSLAESGGTGLGRVEQSVGALCCAVAATEVLVAAAYASGPVVLYSADGLTLVPIAFLRAPLAITRTLSSLPPPLLPSGALSPGSALSPVPASQADTDPPTPMDAAVPSPRPVAAPTASLDIPEAGMQGRVFSAPHTLLFLPCGGLIAVGGDVVTLWS